MEDTIKKLYIEATSLCNLACLMCPRNSWIDETTGHMDYSVFEKALDEAPQSVETVFFGGFGEPLFHPRIIDMITAVKAAGKRAELITNGTMLSAQMSAALIRAGLDRLWVSVDSFDEAEYNEIRSGGDYDSLKKSLMRLKRMRESAKSPMTVGVSFVLMKKNAKKVSRLPAFARRYGVSDIKVTNLVPGTPDMTSEIMYEKTLFMQYGEHIYDVNMDMPMFDINKDTWRLAAALQTRYANFTSMGDNRERRGGYCRFVQEGNVFVRWDGEVSPCMALLHSGKTYLYDWERSIKSASFGNIKQKSLADIWGSPEYSAFRARVRDFDFPRCTACGGCEDLDSNLKDCFGNEFPVCGGCLWAQGLIQCP